MRKFEWNSIDHDFWKFSKVVLFIIFGTFGIGDRLKANIQLISPAEAKSLIDRVDPSTRPIILDTRAGYKDYFRGHLPYAHHINFDTLRGTDQGIPVQYLPDDLTKELLLRAGIDKKRTHLIYAAGASLPNDEVLSASMVAFVLEKYGVENVLILDGGIQGYIAAGYSVTQEYFGNPKGDLPTTGRPEIAVTVNDVNRLKTMPEVVLVDARPRNEYLGEDEVWLRKGHIPGAINFHWARLMSKENTHKFLPFEDTRTALTEAGITEDKDIVVYCGTSREGSLLRFYLKHVAGFPRVRLYEGSWKEYANLKNLPAEAGDRLK